MPTSADCGENLDDKNVEAKSMKNKSAVRI
jgi:hypothetical protein